MTPAMTCRNRAGARRKPATRHRIKKRLGLADINEHLEWITPRPACDSGSLRARTPEYLDTIKTLSQAGGGDARMETPFGHAPVGPGGVEIAALAARGVINARKNPALTRLATVEGYGSVKCSKLGHILQAGNRKSVGQISNPSFRRV
jgi:acetoin utilization deacetylase AcuC-like enzyme